MRESEKRPIMSYRQLTTSFPTSCRWSAYVTRKSLNVGSKINYFVFLSLSQFCPSVRLSDACIVIKRNNRLSINKYLNTIRNRGISSDISSLSTPTGVTGNCPLRPEIFAESDPPVRKTPTSADFHLRRFNGKR